MSLDLTKYRKCEVSHMEKLFILVVICVISEQMFVGYIFLLKPYTVKPRPEAHMDMILFEVFLKNIHLIPQDQGGISSSVLSVFFTDKFALSQSDARISVAYNSCQ